MPIFPYEIIYKGKRYHREEEQDNDSPLFTRRILHDWERLDWRGYVTRPNLPEVYRLGNVDDFDANPTQPRIVNGHYTPLTEEWQFFWFDICCLTYYGKLHNQITKAQYTWLAKRWTSVGANTTAFTNAHGLDRYQNHVLGTNLTTREKPAIYTLWCGGACTKEISKVTNRYGQTMLLIPTFDGTKSPPDVKTIDIRNDPRIFLATNITRTKIGTGYAINPFPQFWNKDNVYQDVPVILLAKRPVYYPAKLTQKIAVDVKLNPYNKPRDTFLQYPAPNVNP